MSVERLSRLCVQDVFAFKSEEQFKNGFKFS